MWTVNHFIPKLSTTVTAHYASTSARCLQKTPETPTLQVGTNDGATTSSTTTTVQGRHHRNATDNRFQQSNRRQGPDGCGEREESPPEQHQHQYQYPDAAAITDAFHPDPTDGSSTYGIIGGIHGSFSPTSTASRESDVAALAPVHTHFSVEVSYLEIYNETLRDLFNSAAPAAPAAGLRAGEWGGGAAGAGAGGGGGGVAPGGGLRLREDPRYLRRAMALGCRFYCPGDHTRVIPIACPQDCFSACSHLFSARYGIYRSTPYVES